MSRAATTSTAPAPAAAATTGAAAAAAAAAAGDAFLAVSDRALESVRASKPWTSNARHFKRVHVSACAAMRMMAHAVSGVEKGIAGGGKPVEVMGLLLGRPSTANVNELVVTDAFPLPVEGAETRVLSDDQTVLNYMIELSESLEKTRKERFMGWYHSHPFDVGVHSHAYLSSTDVSTQLAWQRAEDPHGNPWLAIVVDPLRSLAKGKPELGAFRVFPPEYAAPANTAPDGKVVMDASARIERWGNAWNRYHTLEVEIAASGLGSAVLNTISQKFLWKGALTTTPINDPESRDRFPERLAQVTERLDKTEIKTATEMALAGERAALSRRSGPATTAAAGVAAAASVLGVGADAGGPPPLMGVSGGGGTAGGDEQRSALENAARSATDVAVEQNTAYVSQLVKMKLFG